jgi:hypothetical protein
MTETEHKTNSFEAFQKLYPNLFREYPRSGFYLPKGWETLMHALCPVLESGILKLQEELRSQMQCAQIKEKFGSLRCYLTYSNPYMDGAVAVAEIMSENICEECGQTGKIRNVKGWLTALCDEHHKQKEDNK